MNADDRADITELINRYGHLADAGHFDGMREIVAQDVVHDLTDLGGGVLVGLEALRAATPPGDANPVGHHVTNIVLREDAQDVVTAVSKGIGVMVDGSAHSVVYEDRIERRDRRWRIVHRSIRGRRAPARP